MTKMLNYSLGVFNLAKIPHCIMAKLLQSNLQFIICIYHIMYEQIFVLSLQPDRTLYKVNEPKVKYSGN